MLEVIIFIEVTSVEELELQILTVEDFTDLPDTITPIEGRLALLNHEVHLEQTREIVC